MKDVPQRDRDSIEMYLPYGPWRPNEDEDHDYYGYYTDALNSGLVPEIPSFDWGILNIDAWEDVYGQDSSKLMSDMVQVLKTPVEEANGDT